jgi:hypothetical protein
MPNGFFGWNECFARSDYHDLAAEDNAAIGSQIEIIVAVLGSVTIWLKWNCGWKGFAGPAGAASSAPAQSARPECHRSLFRPGALPARTVQNI